MHLNALLDNLIQFRESRNGSEHPKIESWNPIKRHRQHKELEEWVKSRPPSAGITAEQLGRRYPENLKEKQDIRKGMAWGGGIGAGITGATGATLGALGKFSTSLPEHLHGKQRVIAGIGGGLLGSAVGGGVGAAVGAEIGGYKHFDKRMKDFERAHNKLTKVMTGERAVPVGKLKTDLPRASTYGEVTKELKKQDVGFVPRHATALLTRPMVWSGENAAFVTRGEKGLIVTSPKVHPAVFRHEAGHGKDYAYYGGEQGFHKAYPHYGLPVGIAKREDVISSTMLPEHRAWAYAKPRNKHERDLRDAALTTYRSGLGLSALLDNLIQFDSITYHETEAERHLRKSRVHNEKAAGAFALGGVATTLGTTAISNDYLRSMGVKGVQKAGRMIGGRAGGFIGRWPGAIYAGAAFAPAAAAGGYYGAHKIAAVRQIGKANEEYRKANEVRKKRNALAQSRTQLSVPINFDYAADTDQLKEHARHEATKTALETVYEKLLKQEKPRIRLSSKLDDLIEFQDTRPRSSTTGEFQPQGEGGPDPNAMATVYKIPQPQPQSQITAGGVGKAAGAVFGAGALGAIGASAGKAGWAKGAKLVKRLAAKRKKVLVSHSPK